MTICSAYLASLFVDGRVKLDLDMNLMRSIADISHFHHYFLKPLYFSA